MTQASVRPDLSVVIVTPGRFANIRRTVASLRAQTVRQRIELVVVAPDDAALTDADAGEWAGFHSVAKVAVGPISNVDHAAAPGLLRASAPVVASVEDHAFPEPDWAERLLQAWGQGEPWGAVGSAVLNANPDSGLSWTNMLIAYGQWRQDRPPGPIDWLPAHNVSLRRDLIDSYADELPTLLGREGLLLKKILAAGHRFGFAPQARIHHLNPSTLSATAVLRFDAGRLYGARRRAEERWTAAKRAAYVLAGPLIPFLRFRRLHGELLGRNRPREAAGGTTPALFLGLVFDAAGQMAGYATGAGGAPDRLAVFEMDRMRHITRRDRAEFSPPASATMPARVAAE